MKKIVLFAFTFLCFCLPAAAQTPQSIIEKTDKSIDNLFTALDILGIKIFNYDLSKLPEKMNVIAFVDENAGDSTRRVHSCLLGSTDDIKKMDLYVVPVNDSLVNFHFDSPGVKRCGFLKLKLQPEIISEYGQWKLFNYFLLEYYIDNVYIRELNEAEKSIPLVLYTPIKGSDHLQYVPICGSGNKLLKEQNLGEIAHCYIVGIEIE